VTADSEEVGRARSAGRWLVLAIAALAVVGIGIAGYLTYVHYEGIEPSCTTGGCAKVQASEYSELAGVPVATIGLIGYLTVLASLLVPGELGRAATALVALIGAGYSGYLTYLELAVIDAICQWCVASAVVMSAIAVLAVVRLLRDPPSG
jgi:uncharacterized membrane protein